MLKALTAIAILGTTMTTSAQPAPTADLALLGANIWTNNPDQPAATALAVRDGVIIAVGTDEQIRALSTNDTNIINANGARVLPGLIDAHVHLRNAGETLGWIALRDAASKQELLHLVQTGSQDQAEDEWIKGRGWSAEGWDDQEPPTADELDSAAGGRPAILVRMDGHQLIASRRALELAGVDENTPAPPGGKFGKLPNGKLSGEVYEEAQDLIWQAVPASNEDRMTASRRALAVAAAECVRLGVTQIGAIEYPGAEKAMAALDRDGQFPIRAGVTIHISDDTIEQWRPVLEWTLANQNMSGRVKLLGFKAFMDGTLGSRTAWMVHPYEDNPEDEDPDNAGFPLAMAGDGTLRELIHLGASMGLQPIVHAIGTKANHELLNWYEELPESTRARVRPRVEHAQHVLGEDIERFAALGVIPSMQPLHKADDGRYAHERMTDEDLRSSYAFRDFVDQHANLAFGSDWPVVSVNPFLGIHAAVSAKTMDGGTFLPEQAITVEESLRAYTTGAAHALFTESYTGALIKGFAADFIILDRDILKIPVEDIPNTAVTTTVVGGDIVHSAD